MAALLAGARLVLRQGFRLLPVYARRPGAAPVRSLSASSRFCTLVSQEKGDAEADPSLGDVVKEWQGSTIHMLGFRLRRKGRVDKPYLLRAFEENCRTGHLNSSKAWFFLRACGSSMPSSPPAERTEVADNIWKNLKAQGVELNVMHYNTLLEVYIENEHVFSPTDFLATMEAANVEPDQDTYQGLIAAYCNEGDMDSTSKILEFMKSKNFPITKEVFSSLIKGHARAGDMESAKNILSIMQDCGIPPRWSTYLTLLNVYAGKGEIENIRQILNDSNVHMQQKHLTSVILTLAKSGYSQYIPDVLEHMPDHKILLEDFINLSLTLLTQGYEDTALEIATQIRGSKLPSRDLKVQPGDFFLNQCVNLNLPIDFLNKCASELQAAAMHNQPKEYMLECASRTGNLELSTKLLKAIKEERVLLKSRTFSAMLSNFRNRKDLPGLIVIIRSMKNLGLYTLLPHLSRCMAWIFSEANSGQAILQDKACLEDLQQVCLSSVIHSLLSGQLTHVEEFLSSLPTQIPVSRGLMGALGTAFIKYKDVKTLVKITGLLYKDGSDSKASSSLTDFISYFLYFVIDRMSDSEAEAMEEHLRQYFHQLMETGLPLDEEHYRAIKEVLEQDGMFKAGKNFKNMLKSEELLKMKQVKDTAKLEEELANLEMNDHPNEAALLRHVTVLHALKDLPKALQLKEKHKDDFTFSMYMKLLDICSETNNTWEALELKKEIDQKKFVRSLSVSKYLHLIQLFTENGLIEDAINILKEMQEKDVRMNEANSDFFYNVLNSMALKGDAEALNKVHETSVMMGLVIPSGWMCSPLVFVHLAKDDLPAAVDALLDNLEKHKCVALLHEVLVKLMSSGETNLIKKLLDSVGAFLGELSMLHQLFFAFIAVGKYNEAKEIAETPGLRAIPDRLRWFTNRCLRKNQVEELEKCVELSQKLFNCDREEMYSQLFRIYDKNDEWEKAKSAWCRMREENVRPEMFLRSLENLFKRNRQDIHLHIPEFANFLTSTRQSAGKGRDLGREVNAPEEFDDFLEAEQNPFGGRTYAELNRASAAEGSVQGAAEVEAVAKIRGTKAELFAKQVKQNALKDALVTLQRMLQSNSIPKRFWVSKLLNEIALDGDVLGLEKIQKLKEHHPRLAEVLPKYLDTFVVLAHLRNGNVEEGISMMETLYMEKPQKALTTHLMHHLLTCNMEEAVEKMSILVERMANQFAIYEPVTDLFGSYILKERGEEARHLLQRCNAILEQRETLVYTIIRWVMRRKEEYATRLIELLSDPYYVQFLYTFKMVGYGFKKDVDAAVALYENAKAEHIETDELFLKQLAILLRDGERPVPFSEPPESLEYYRKMAKQQMLQGQKGT